MTTKRFGRVFLVAAVFGSFFFVAFADEIVHFTNGAEMTVRSHTVEKAKEMVKLDLGGNSFISFPLSMVDKIVSAGHNVFLNPVFHPANQAIAGSPGAPVTDNTVRGIGESVGSTRRPVVKGTAGAMLGEAADAIPIPASGVAPMDQSVANSRRVFNPTFPAPPGGAPQVILPPSAPKTPVQMAFRPPRAPEQPAPTTPPVSSDPASDPPTGDPPPEDPPETP